MTISPFADETEADRIGDLTVENRVDRVSIYGSVDITRDKDGLAYARRLKALLDAVVVALEADPSLPETLPPPPPTDEVPNPFA